MLYVTYIEVSHLLENGETYNSFRRGFFKSRGHLVKLQAKSYKTCVRSFSNFKNNKFLSTKSIVLL